MICNKKERESIYRTIRRILKDPTTKTVEKEMLVIVKKYPVNLTKYDAINIANHLHEGTGFCYLVDSLYRANLISFPELLHSAPANMYYPDAGWWFRPGDYRSRIELLDSIIKKMDGRKKK